MKAIQSIKAIQYRAYGAYAENRFVDLPAPAPHDRQVLVLTEFVAFKPGQRVLAPGIGGAVGMESVQIARKLGASLAISTASTSAKAEKAHVGGYEHVIDLSRESLRDGVMRLTGGKGVDVIIDGVGGKLTGEALGCLLPGGTYAVVGYAGRRAASVNLIEITSSRAKVHCLP